MNRKQFFPWMLGLALLAAVASTFSACSRKDDENKKDESAEEVKYDDLAYFQEALCTIDSVGVLVQYELGAALDEKAPGHRYIGVDTIEEAARMFAGWMAPDVKLGDITPDMTELTAALTDEEGKAQGTLYFRKGSGTSVAEVTASSETALGYVERITFLQNSAWPYNSDAIQWHKGDIRKFALTGDIVKYLKNEDRELPFVLVREASNGVSPMWVALSYHSYEIDDHHDDRRKSIYCPGEGKAKEISSRMSAEWDFFKSRFIEARSQGGGELRDGGSYWIDHKHGTLNWFWDMIMLSNGWIHGGKGIDRPSEQYLLKIDWIEDGEFPLTATGGTDIGGGEDFQNIKGGCYNLFDGRNDTRWCTNHYATGAPLDPLYWVEFESDTPITPKGYMFVTSNKSQWPEKTGTDTNPYKWILYGKKKLRDNWTLLDQRSGENLPRASYKEARYSISQGVGEYQYFRLELPDNQPWLAIAEFKFTY